MIQKFGRSLLSLCVVNYTFTLIIAQFTVQPESVVQAEGLEAVFQCLYTGAAGHGWRINSSFRTDADFPSDFTRTHPSGDTPATLTIPALPQYNNTVVQCEANVRDGGDRRFVLSENATLQVQGFLEPVTGLYFKETLSSMINIIISWIAPFSLDLTTADPDIQYCVEVYSVTGGGSHHLDSVCRITDTQYTYTAPDPTGVYSFTVTPRSNIQGSLNGNTSQPVEGYTKQMPVVIPAHDIDVNVNVGANSVDLVVEFPRSAIEDVFPGSKPTSYTMGLVFLDGTLSSPCYCDTTHVVRNGMVVLEDVDCTPCVISRHVIFKLTLITHNSVGSSTSDPLEISTHDTQVQDVVYSNEMEQVVVNCSYLEGSQDVGFLLIVSSESGFNYGVVYREEGEEFTAVAINGTEGSRVLVYDLQNDGPLQNKPAIIEPNSAVLDDSPVPDARSLSVPSQTNVSVTTSDGEICLSCYANSCLGIIHSLDTNDYNLICLYYTAESDSTCTSNSLRGNFSVAVFGYFSGRLDESPVFKSEVTLDMPKTNEHIPPSQHTALFVLLPCFIILSLAVIIVIILGCALLCRWKRKSKGKLNLKDRKPKETGTVK